MTPTAAQQASSPQVFNPRENGSDYFWYSHSPVTQLQSTAPNAAAIINIDADSDFYCVALSYQASVGDATAGALTESTNIIPLVTLQITDTGSGKSLMNTPLPMGAFLGDGKRPYRLARPRVFMRNATIQLAFVSYVASGTIYRLQVVFHGYKIYR